MSTDIAVPPPVLWTQRKSSVLLTFNVECKEPKINVEKDSVYFKGTCGPENKLHEVTIQLYDTVIPQSNCFVNKGRCIEMILQKEKEGSWPSLSKEQKKLHYLKIDFNKWVDENDEGEGDDGQLDIMDMLKSMGEPGGNGDETAKKPSFDDLESDSDDENLPDLE